MTTFSQYISSPRTAFIDIAVMAAILALCTLTPSLNEYGVFIALFVLYNALRLIPNLIGTPFNNMNDAQQMGYVTLAILGQLLLLLSLFMISQRLNDPFFGLVLCYFGVICLVQIFYLKKHQKKQKALDF